jgi:hypothetical protein
MGSVGYMVREGRDEVENPGPYSPIDNRGKRGNRHFSKHLDDAVEVAEKRFAPCTEEEDNDHAASTNTISRSPFLLVATNLKAGWLPPYKYRNLRYTCTPMEGNAALCALFITYMSGTGTDKGKAHGTFINLIHDYLRPLYDQYVEDTLEDNYTVEKISQLNERLRCRNPEGSIRTDVHLVSPYWGKEVVNHHRRLFYDNIDKGYDLFIHTSLDLFNCVEDLSASISDDGLSCTVTVVPCKFIYNANTVAG